MADARRERDALRDALKHLYHSDVLSREEIQPYHEEAERSFHESSSEYRRKIVSSHEELRARLESAEGALRERDKMTIERAIEILNRERHGMHDDWFYLGEMVYQRDSGGDPIFTDFEAIAIAEKHERGERS